MRVPLLDLKPQYQALKNDIDAAIARVCESQNFILGPAVRDLEAAVARYSQCARGVGVSSGTDALLLVLMAMGIGPGDEVVTTPYTFFATAGTIARAGARPVFCDIDPGNFNIDVSAVRQFIEQHCESRSGQLVNRATGGVIKAVMPVHLYGQVCELEPIAELCRRHGLKLIEDAAQAIGAEDSRGRRAGSIGDVGCLSFFPTKNLGAFGDAGMCVTNDPALAERMEIFRVHGSKPKYYHEFVGGNFRLDELQAAVLGVKLPHLDSWTEGRQRNAAIYDSAFAASRVAGEVVTPPRCAAGARHIYNQYVIRTPRRDELRNFLAEKAIGTEVYYPVPLHLQRCFAYLGHKQGDFPASERAALETLALPIYPELSEAQLRHVVATIEQFLTTGA